MAKSVSRDLAIYNLDPNQKNINLEARVIARNGYFICRLNSLNIDDKNVLHARQTIKVEGDKTTVLSESVSPDFPRKENGEINWTS